LAKRGVVTSTTVMIRKKFIESEKLLSLKNISIGLHLDLSEKSSLKEVENQLKLFEKKFKKTPSHLDGHRHCHLSKNNLLLVLKIAKKYNLPIRSRFLKDRKKIKKFCLKTPGSFISWHPDRLSILKERLAKIKTAAAELVCHPGYYDKKSTYPYNQKRKKELNFLKSRQFNILLKKFKPINYNEL